MCKRISQFSIILCITAMSWSCSNQEKGEGSQQMTPKNYETYVADSVTFEYLSPVELLDYDEPSQEMILKDRLTKEILIVDGKGELLTKFNPHQQGPGYVGDFDFGWTFYGEDQLICYGRYYFYQLTRQGEYIAKHKYPVDVVGLWLLDYNPEMAITYTSNKKLMLLAFITEPDGPRYNTQAFQDSVHMIYKMDLAAGTAAPVMQKKPESIYRTLGSYVDRGWPYFAQVDNNKVVVTYSIDDKFYLYDAETNELLQEFEIPEAFKPKFESIPFESKGSADVYSASTRVLSDGKHIILRVRGMIPASVERVLSRQDNWRESQAYKEAREKYATSESLLYDLSGQYLGTVKNGAGMLSYDAESTSDGFYWIQRRYSDERDYKTFLKIKVAPEN